MGLLLPCNKMPSRLATSLCGIPLRNPVLAASGTYAYGVELRDLVDLSAVGGIVVKGLSREPMDGNPPPRVWETESGMINSIGLQNIGVRAFVAEKLPDLRGITIFANVSSLDTSSTFPAPTPSTAESSFRATPVCWPKWSEPCARSRGGP
jgi:dihydroorotate dehydrogenase